MAAFGERECRSFLAVPVILMGPGEMAVPFGKLFDFGETLSIADFCSGYIFVQLSRDSQPFKGFVSKGFPVKAKNTPCFHINDLEDISLIRQ